MGRLNSSTVDYWISEDGLLLLEAWSRDGLKLGQIADNMGIKQAKLSQWRKEYEEIDEALKSGKEVVDYKVENALLKAALGFKTKEITVTIGRRQVNGEWVNLTKETKIKEIAPSVTACLAWLNNRKPNTWKRNRDNIVEVDDEDNDVRITIIRGKGNDLDDDVNTTATIDQDDIKREKQKLEKQKEDEWEGWENW